MEHPRTTGIPVNTPICQQRNLAGACVMDKKYAPFSVEATQEEWDRIGRKEHASLMISLRMRVGQILTVHHPDMFCDGGSSCSLRSALSKRRSEGKWSFKHISPGVSLIRRVE